jgi:hypothetical protein
VPPPDCRLAFCFVERDYLEWFAVNTQNVFALGVLIADRVYFRTGAVQNRF